MELMELLLALQKKQSVPLVLLASIARKKVSVRQMDSVTLATSA